MDLIYGKDINMGDPNYSVPIPRSIVAGVTTSWTNQSEAMNNQLSISLPYYPKISNLGTTVPNTIIPLFSIPLFDRYFPKSTTVAYNGILIEPGSVDIGIKYINPLPMSMKQNYPFRMTSNSIKITILFTTSTIIQGTLGIYLSRNFLRTQTFTEQNFKFQNVVDAANALAIINLAIDRSITLEIPYDEMYNALDYSDQRGIQQIFTRALTVYPMTPLLVSTDTPTTLFASVMFGTGVPNATYLVNAPNLTMIQTQPSDINPASQESSLKRHHTTKSSGLSKQLERIYQKLNKKFNLENEPTTTTIKPTH